MNKTINLNGNGKIIVSEEKTEIYVPHLNDVLAFGLPMETWGNYQDTMLKIGKKGLRPTTAQTLSLVNLALQNQDEENCKNLLDKFAKKYLWTSTENLWGKEDVIVYDNPDGNMPSDRKSLIKMHKAGNPAVRIVKYGFKTGSQSVSEFLENPYVLAQIGKEQMFDIVAKVAKGVSLNPPRIWVLKQQNLDIKGYTALFSGWKEGRLTLNGYYSSCNFNGYASPIHAIIHNLKQGETK